MSGAVKQNAAQMQLLCQQHLHIYFSFARDCRDAHDTIMYYSAIVAYRMREGRIFGRRHQKKKKNKTNLKPSGQQS